MVAGERLVVRGTSTELVLTRALEEEISIDAHAACFRSR